MWPKRNLELKQVTTVDVASNYAARLLEREYRGPGDNTEDAMRRIEAKTGVSYWSLWSLRYKRPKTVRADIFQQLQQAYLALCEKDFASLKHELAVEQAISGEPHDSYADLETEVAALAEKIRRAKTRLGAD